MAWTPRMSRRAPPPLHCAELRDPQASLHGATGPCLQATHTASSPCPPMHACCTHSLLVMHCDGVRA
ncbi:hypothetical protein QTO34_015448 [Cnephaeus nilssonii]|uniref:Uncharacterized protein n=1 Tax=Cnephaeus nilssonii TaxID=3371016 RepID=A0AA40I446_CNENI|nr:hypothetical protein QTO34_015448 [Eptesicus nilssonii]